MLDSKGNLLTSNKAIEKRALEVFSERLEGNTMKDHLKDLDEETNYLCDARTKLVKLNKTAPWTIEELKDVLKKLDNDKSRDAEGHCNELFKENAEGTDLVKAVLSLMNLIKEKQEFPKIMEKCNITTLHKKKSKQDFSNYRGIFRVSTLRSILDRLIYNSCYETIDSNLSDGNVGARKRRGCRDNIFVLSAINNSVLNGKSDSIQIQVTDVKTCFDKLWLQSSINKLYENGLNNDMLNLLYIENKNVQIAVKVNGGLTKRVNVKDIELQGSVWAGLKCTSVMDNLNKTVMADESLQYYYKEDKDIPIGVRGMIDDTLGVSKCGNSAIKLNAVINSFVESQRLEMSKEKSVVIHVGRKHENSLPCPTLKVHDSDMIVEDSVKYLGNILTSKGGIKDTIEDRRNKGWGKVAAIKGILSQIDMGDNRVEMGLLLRKSILVNSLLFTAETWSNLKEADIKRLEQVDQGLLSSLVSGHSKCASEFVYLETGSLKLRHILTQNRLMFHHYLLGLNEEETLKKVYEKQKKDPTKSDWFQLLTKDFQFIEETMDENK